MLSGDKQMFAVLVSRYQAGLYRHAVAMVLDHDVAADMVQDTFVRAYTRLSTCREHDRFRAWIFQMLRNRCLDHLKDVRRRNVPLDRALEIEDPAEEPIRPMERARLRGEIAKALEQLPDCAARGVPDALRRGASVRNDGGAARRVGQRAENACAPRPRHARAGFASKDVTLQSPIRLLFRRS